VIGRFCDRLSESAKIQNAIDRADEAIEISMLTEAVFRQVVV
jgi:hypothetical protein